MVIAFSRINPPEAHVDPPPLAARIVSAPPAHPMRAAKPTPPPPHSSPKRPTRVGSVALPVVLGPSPIAVRPGSTAIEMPTLQEPPEAQPYAAAIRTEPALIATAPSLSDVPEPPPLRTLPRRGEITYDIVYGRDKFPVGRTVQTWETDGASYKLASRSETTGIIHLFRSQHRTYFSRGKLTREGLRPDTFLMSRDRGRGTEEARAQFHWDKGSVTLGTAAQQREQELPGGSQDLVSFMYQLSIAPPAQGRIRMSVTNGSRLEMYELDVLPEERIETPLGVMRALPIRQVRTARAETIDIWLATEYRHLPVRVRFYGRDGEPAGEQIVTEIRLTED